MNLQAKRAIRGDAARGGAVGECRGIRVEVKIVRGDGLEVGGLRVEPTGRARALGAGGTGSAWQRKPPSSASNQSSGLSSLAARCLRRAMLSARALGRWRTMSPSSSVVREPLAPTLVFIPARAPPTSFASGPSMSASTATESGAGVGCHVRVTKSPRDVPAVEHARGVVAETLEGARGGGRRRHRHRNGSSARTSRMRLLGARRGEHRRSTDAGRRGRGPRRESGAGAVAAHRGRRRRGVRRREQWPAAALRRDLVTTDFPRATTLTVKCRLSLHLDGLGNVSPIQSHVSVNVSRKNRP